LTLVGKIGARIGPLGGAPWLACCLARGSLRSGLVRSGAVEGTS